MAIRLLDGRRLAAAAVCMGFALGSSTGAQSRSAPSQPPAVSEVLVHASPGPALWRITKGASELVVLGVVSPTPKNEAWNGRLFVQALQGARVLMLSPGSTPGFAWADYFPESERFRLGQPFGRTLAKEVGPDAEARLDRMAGAIRQPPGRYSGYRPGPAGMILLEDSWIARGLSGSQVDDTTIALARMAHVPVVKVDEGGALPLIDAMPSMSDLQHDACLREAMDQFEREDANAHAVFRAWADRDLAALQNLYKPLSLCMTSIPGGVQRRDRARTAWLKALSHALAIPGRAVIVMDVADLLEPSDLLAALRAEGATVTEPQGAPKLPPGLTLATAGGSLEGAAPIAVTKSMPAGFQVTSADLPEIAYVKTSREPGREGIVDIAGNQVTCISEVPIGSIIAQKICHTSSQWEEIAKQREITVRDFYRNRHENRLPASSPGASE